MASRNAQRNSLLNLTGKRYRHRGTRVVSQEAARALQWAVRGSDIRADQTTLIETPTSSSPLLSLSPMPALCRISDSSQQRAKYEKCQIPEVAIYSITSSARASSISGMSSLNERAVCRLMTNSNLVERFYENDPMGFDPTFVIPGCVPAGDSRSERRPGIHSPCGGYGFRSRLCRASRVTRAPE